MSYQTEFEFTLPKGYIDKNGKTYNQGVMRLATAGDEIKSMEHPKARANPEYTSILVLSKVIRMDALVITPEIIESLFTADVKFLQNMYETINTADDFVMHVRCPHCGEEFIETINFTQTE